MKRKIFKKIFGWGVAIAVLVAGILIVAYNSFYGMAVNEDYSIFVGNNVQYDDFTAEVKKNINSPLKSKAFDYYALHLNLASRLKAGHYTLKQGQSVISVVRMFVLGEQTPVNLVVGQARTLPQLAGKLSKQIMADSTALLLALRNSELKSKYGYKKDSIIAMFVPNTYQVYWTITPEQLLERMNREYKAFWNRDREAKLATTKLTKYQAMTLASIVYEETKNRGEMPKIAGVYINRLRKKMPLQACPTVKYAMGDFTLTRILHRHLRYDSPFNTYRNAGLPPAPICIPSIAAIDAVLNYDKNNYLYFCAKPEFDGTHNFARTLREHNANSRRYNEALKRLKK
ncbi:MAG: endolytic transglycosylase MltG [Rikenellaceae bacterium]|nr:endolytic transglycosylase MltG [Rikenellaceae bacterium]